MTNSVRKIDEKYPISIDLSIGERKGYKKRVFLLHDGIHFDALYLTRNGKTVTVFSTDEEKVKGQALSLAGDLNDVRRDDILKVDIWG